MFDLRRAVLSAVAGLGLAAGAHAAPAAAETVIRIGGVANYGPVIPVMVAQELDLFAKAGVSVEFTNYAGGAASMEGLAAGEADLINFFPPGLALAKRGGVDARIVGAGTLTPRGWHLVVAPDSDITDLAGLAGKRVGITANGSTTDFFALWAADAGGADIVRVPLGGAGLVPNLISGNVDAIVAYPPLSYRLLQAGEGKSLVHFGDAMETNLPDVWAASQDVIDRDPEALRKALTGLYSAIVHMQANRDWTVDFIVKQTGLDRAVAEAEYDNTILGLSPDGRFEHDWVAASLKLGTLAGMSDMPAPEEMYADGFAPVTTIEP
jgi:NitT/TauT family transport system substrate-binding protein